MSDDMTTAEKWREIKALCGRAKVLLGSTGKYYVSLPSIERKERGLLTSGSHFHCATVNEAIAATWAHLTTPQYVFVRGAFTPKRWEFRYNAQRKEFMTEGEAARDYSPESA